MHNSSLLSEAPNLGLHSSNQNCLLLLSENILPQLSMEDQAMHNVFFDPEQVQPLLTLQEEVAEKEKPPAGNNYIQLIRQKYL